MKLPTLRRRLYTLLAQWFLLFLVVSSLVSFMSFSRFRKNALDERLLLARTVARYLDSTVATAIQSLGRLAAQLPSLDASAVDPMRSFRFQSLFRDAIYILDEQANRIVADPPFAEPLPLNRLVDHEAVTPLFYKSDGTERPTLAIVQPFRRAGRQYYIVSEMNPMGSMMNTFLQSLGTEPDLHVVVVDAHGVVIAAPDQKQLFRSMSEAAMLQDRIAAHRPLVLEGASCGVCETDHQNGGFLTVMVPLRYAPWGIVVQQHKKIAFAAVYTSQWGFLAAGALLVLMGVFLSRALLRSVVAPIQSLSHQAELLRHGDLSRVIRVAGDHEIEVLATTLDAARQRLASTLGELQSLNENLEAQVASRTEVLTAQYDNLRLLHDVAQASTRERELEHFLPDALRLVAEHYAFPAVGLVTMPLDAHPESYAHPAGASLSWLRPDASPPAGWQRRDLLYQGRQQAQLYCPALDPRDEEVMAALQQQLAMSLHGFHLLKRTLAQDGQRRVLVRRLLDASEEERRRIARELHDEIAQLLTVIQLSLNDVSLDTAEMRKAKDLLTETQREIHRIIYDLRPSLLDDLGLSAAVKSYGMSYLDRQGIAANLEIEEDLRLSPEIEIATFRIYQEIVTNILRHAKAENVSIELYVADGQMVLGVEDDGVGFNPDEKFEGVGLVGMRERAALVNGTITFTSEPGTGTYVVLKVPLPP